MIEIVKGTLFTSSCQAIAIPVNCVGVAGCGLAAAMKFKYNDCFLQYREACRDHRLIPGRVFVASPDRPIAHDYVVCFPTKLHWSKPSKLDYIMEGIENLLEVMTLMNIKSIALPALGCGKGELSWEVVSAFLKERLEKEESFYFELYEPETWKTA